MPDSSMTVDEILQGAQNYDAGAEAALRAQQTVALGRHLEVCFETRKTALSFLQSLVALEGLSCPVSLAAERHEAASLWQHPAGILILTLRLVPRAGMTPAALCASLVAPIDSLCLDVAGHLCRIVLEGPLAPRAVARVSLSPQARQALTERSVDVALSWQGPAPSRVAIPPALWTSWPLA